MTGKKYPVWVVMDRKYPFQKPYTKIVIRPIYGAELILTVSQKVFDLTIDG